MKRNYLRTTIWGTGYVNGREISCKETVIYQEGQDPLQLAMKRNSEMPLCYRFWTEVPERAFSIDVEEMEKPGAVKQEPKMFIYRDMRNKWREIERIW